MALFQQISWHDYQSSSISNLRARIFGMLWETDTEFFPNALTFSWIKDAIYELNIRDVFFFQEMEWEFTLPEWENKVALPYWFKREKRLRVYADWKYWSELEYIPSHLYNEWNWKFTIRNNTLFVPTAIDKITYRLDYIWIPDVPKNESDVSLIPMQYDESIINYVVAKAKMSEWMMNDAHTFMVMFENSIERIKLESIRRAMTPIPSFWMNNIV